MLGLSLPAHPSFDFEGACDLVAVEPDRDASPCPVELRGEVFIDAIHDGNCLPAEYLGHAATREEALHEAYAASRDWGAAMLAGHIASALHLPGFFRVRTARALLDFGRFPGVSSPDATVSSRLAVNPPFDGWLDFAQKRHLFSQHYDVITRCLEEALYGVKLKIAVHTYDERGPDGSKRPPVSLRTRADWPSGSELWDRFDPLFPRALTAHLADRLLRARLSLTLEENGVEVAENAPHPLPLGAVEVRMLVRRYFELLEAAYRAANPSAIHPADAWDLVWDMLKDCELRSMHGLAGFLHRMQEPPEGAESLFEAGRSIYAEVASFADDVQDDLVDSLRSPPEQFGCLVLEVRKDLVWNFVGGPFGAPRRDDIRRLAQIVAAGLQRYLMEDRMSGARLGDKGERMVGSRTNLAAFPSSAGVR
ncbi:MAG: hypothetical protein ACFB9M_13310 [Myxococcota bacterium]